MLEDVAYGVGLRVVLTFVLGDVAYGVGLRVVLTFVLEDVAQKVPSSRAMYEVYSQMSTTSLARVGSWVRWRRTSRRYSDGSTERVSWRAANPAASGCWR